LSLSEAPSLAMMDAAAFTEVEASLRRRRERAAAGAKRVGQRPKVARHVEWARKLAKTFGRMAGRKPAMLEEQLRERLRQRVTALLRDDPRAETTDLHQARIRVKQL